MEHYYSLSDTQIHVSEDSVSQKVAQQDAVVSETFLGAHTDPESDGDDASSIASETSTIYYDQEPYQAFQYKAVLLCQGLFTGHSAKDIVLERMKGGSFNRITGVSQ
jgi:hypothetical protein